ncbi:MAG TPA: thioesterase family protein [Bryobacteraceae bacterium]|nr:thioesterase family protein [Bryobacteraceae bacterium]
MPSYTETRLRARYAETDQMGVVYYANHYIWMEVARVDLCKASGFDYRDMERGDGIFMAVAESACRYRAPAHFDDEIVIKSWIAEANPRAVTIEYEMRLAEGDRLLATGHTRHIFVNREMRRSRLPEKYYPMFGIAERSDGDENDSHVKDS